MTDNISGEQVSYTYDQLNRLVQSVSSVTGTMPFAYDGFDNLTQQGQTTLSIDPTTNRINSAGYQYNANGNVTQTPNPTYAYDVANRLVSNGAIYNPRNQRVFDGTNIYLYTPEGKLAGKYTANWSTSGSVAFIQGGQPNVYFAGKLIQEQGQWVMTDRLGSVRLNATSGRSSYQPYGAEVTPTSDQRTKFATYYRDSAGLDYAGQRYYGNAMGRFLTPDPGGTAADASDPGSWNRYAYVGGDPVNFADQTGRIRNIVGNCGDLVNGQPQDGCDDDGGGDYEGGNCTYDTLGFEENPLCSDYVPPSARQKPPCPPKYQAWIDAHGADALGAGLPEANTLALTSIESKWGMGRFAIDGNDFFNLEAFWKPGKAKPGNKYAYQLGWMQALEMKQSGTLKGYYAFVATYSSAKDSFLSAAATFGNLTATDPTTFANNAAADGIDAGKNPAFLTREKIFADCLAGQ
jgi:RHS repeat-associated protein